MFYHPWHPPVFLGCGPVPAVDSGHEAPSLSDGGHTPQNVLVRDHQSERGAEDEGVGVIAGCLFVECGPCALYVPPPTRADALNAADAVRSPKKYTRIRESPPIVTAAVSLVLGCRAERTGPSCTTCDDGRPS